MSVAFEDAKFKGNLSNWKPYKLESITDIFSFSETPIPYWAEDNYREKSSRNKAIEQYNLIKDLNHELSIHNETKKKLKI
jgi:hypothetical protein